MSKTDEEIRNEWKALDTKNVEMACEFLSRHEIQIQDYLADIVSSLCNTGKAFILCLKNKELKYVHARWLLWYAYKYLTAESYKTMSMNKLCSCVDVNSIRYGVTKMDEMIEREPLWKKRWTIVKRILDMRNDTEPKIDNVIVIQVPRDIKDKIKIQIKDK